MVSSNISEESSDWEEIQYPYNDDDKPPSSSPQKQEFDLRRVILQDNFYGESFVFPPSEHEGLPLEPEECESPKVVELSRSPSPHQQETKTDSKVEVIMGRVRVGMCMVWGKMSAFVSSGFGSCPSPVVVPAAALAVAILSCVKILQWRNRVLLLLKEKDQKIRQLLHQIARLNETLSGRRRVPVLRIDMKSHSYT